MLGCPRCGGPRKLEDRVCANCGLGFEGVPAAAPLAPGAKPTLFGMGSLAEAQGQPDPALPLGQTRLGHAAPNAPPGAPAGAIRPGHPQTLLGIPALSVQAGVHAAPPAAGAAPPAAPKAVAAPPAAQQRVPSQFKTVIGVARPGIAPSHPGVARARVNEAPRVHLHPQVAPVAVPAPPPAFRPRADAPPRRRKLAWVGGLVLILAVSLLTVAALALMTRRSGPVAATLRADDNGRELLELVCAECVDGTVARLAGGSATFSSGKARLELGSLLPVGDHELDLSLKEPDSREARSVRVIVPVHYRLRGDFSGLEDPRPELRVVVEAVRESAVVIDGRAIRLDGSGKGTHRIDVAQQLTGEALSSVTLERSVPYTITTPGAAAQSGGVRLKIGVVPLQVTAPGESLVVDTAHFMLAGRTQALGTVSVGGRPITVDANGRFAQMMSVSTVGETTIEVRASAAQQAPRLFPLHVKRVKSLKEEAVAFSAGASHGLSGIATDPHLKKGWKVVLPGTVVETRSEHHTSITLLEVKQGCPMEPCLVRLVYGAEISFGKGAAVRAFGHVLGAVDGPRAGSQIPEVRVQFYLSEQK